MKKLVEVFYGDGPEDATFPRSAYEKAKDAMVTYGRLLVAQGLHYTMGVTIEKYRTHSNRKGWALYVEDLEVTKDGV